MCLTAVFILVTTVVHVFDGQGLSSNSSLIDEYYVVANNKNNFSTASLSVGCVGTWACENRQGRLHTDYFVLCFTH